MKPVETPALEREDFLEFIRMYPDMAIRLLAVLAQWLRNATSQIESVVFTEPPSCMARKLLELMESHGHETSEGCVISMRLPQAELAGMIGTTMSSVADAQRLFEDAHILSVKNGHYIIHNLVELRNRAMI
ncbi:MAG: Crp/Fnr family transcriptional regulator [Chloroflexota bacterium]|nr:Crp/Fnr family transcriptional regulator [Chloroflexota bacterium]